MGTRHEEIIVVDLDGTLVRGNTLHMLMVWMSRHLPLASSLKVCHAAIRRLCGVDTHVSMKVRVLEIAKASMTSEDIERFVGTVMTRLNGEVLAISSRYAYKVLATAAPDFYASPIAERLGFEGCLASDINEVLAEGVELRGQRKLDSVREYAQSRGLQIGAVVTDHKDDLALLTMPGIERYLVCPDKELCKILDSQSLPYNVVKK